ncbi:MAG: hypothetical protein HGA71_15155 [Azonexaceae bacterium]|nr:hypothetical protein [Azonexaceae bacterium]
MFVGASLTVEGNQNPLAAGILGWVKNAPVSVEPGGERFQRGALDRCALGDSVGEQDTGEDRDEERGGIRTWRRQDAGPAFW